MVDVIGADNRAGKLHEDVILLVSTFSRGEETDRIRPGILLDLA